MAANHLRSVICTVHEKTSQCEQACSEHVSDSESAALSELKMALKSKKEELGGGKVEAKAGFLI